MIKALWSLFGGLSSRGRRQRRGGDAAPSGSADLPNVPYFDPRGGGPPPGVGGKRRSACQTGLLLRLRIGRYRCVAWHRIALREARALPPSHIISHSLRAVALCRRWQRWSIDNIDLKVSARQYQLGADRGCSSSMRDVRVGVGCWEGLEVGRGHSPARS